MEMTLARRRIWPEHVSEFQDRHGKTRLRFRKKGHPTRYFKAAPGSMEFIAELAAFRDDAPPSVGADLVTPGSISDLVSRYFTSSDFRNGGLMSQRKNRGILEAFRKANGEKRAVTADFQAIDKILAEKAATHPAAARNLRKQLRRMFAYAVLIKMVPTNPVDGVRLATKKVGPDDETGHHTWTEAEIERFQDTHPIGTKPRLAMELMLWTGCRRGDAVRLGRQHMKDGRLSYNQEKTNKSMKVAIAAQLKAAIDAMPSTNMTFIVTAYGKPFTSNGFGGWFRIQCDKAGLTECSAHGLRKAMARRLADNGVGNQGIKSVTGHSSDAEVSHYTRAVDQGALADSTIGELSRAHLANRKAANG